MTNCLSLEVSEVASDPGLITFFDLWVVHLTIPSMPPGCSFLVVLLEDKLTRLLWGVISTPHQLEGPGHT